MRECLQLDEKTSNLLGTKLLCALVDKIGIATSHQNESVSLT